MAHEIKATISYFQAENILPIDAGTHRISGLPICESLAILHDGDQGQTPWSLGTLTTTGKQISKILIFVQLS